MLSIDCEISFLSDIYSRSHDGVPTHFLTLARCMNCIFVSFCFSSLQALAERHAHLPLQEPITSQFFEDSQFAKSDDFLERIDHDELTPFAEVPHHERFDDLGEDDDEDVETEVAEEGEQHHEEEGEGAGAAQVCATSFSLIFIVLV